MMRDKCEQAHRLFLLDYLRKEIHESGNRIYVLRSRTESLLERIKAEQERLDEFEEEYKRLKSAKF